MNEMRLLYTREVDVQLTAKTLIAGEAGGDATLAHGAAALAALVASGIRLLAIPVTTKYNTIR
jgi:hypothetical protein